MKTYDLLAAGSTIAQLFDRSGDAQAAAARLRSAGFSDVRLSERAGRTTEEHVNPGDGSTEIDFAALLAGARFSEAQARELTRSVAAGAVLLTVAGGARLTDAAAVLRGETVAAHPLGARQNAVAVSPLPAHPTAPAPSALELRTGRPRLPLYAERLDVSKERRTGEARVRKEVVTERRTVSVPVQREQLVVERDGQPPVRLPLSEPEP